MPEAKEICIRVVKDVGYKRGSRYYVSFPELGVPDASVFAASVDSAAETVTNYLFNELEGQELSDGEAPIPGDQE